MRSWKLYGGEEQCRTGSPANDGSYWLWNEIGCADSWWSFLSPAVVAADSLAKRDVFRLPDPFAVITIDGEQTNTTTAIKVSFATHLLSFRR